MFLKISSSTKIRSIILLLSAVLAVWFFIMVANQFVIRPKADENSVSTQFNPGSIVLDVSASKPVLFSIATAQNSGIMGVDAVFHITGPVTLKQISEISSSSTTAKFTNLTKTDNRFSFTTTADRQDLPSVVSIPLEVECSSAGQATIELDKERSQFLGTATSSIFEIEDSNTLSIDCGGVGAFGSQVPATAKIAPALASTSVGQTMRYQILLSPSGQTGISAFNLGLKFNPDIVEVVSIEEPVVGVQTPDQPTEKPGANTTPPVDANPRAQMFGLTPPARAGSCTTDVDCPLTCLVASQCPAKCVNGVCEYSSSGPVPTSSTGGGGSLTPTAGSGINNPPADGSNPGIGESDVFVKIKNEIDPNAGTIQLAYVVIDEDSKLPRSVMMELVLKGKKDGSGRLTFEKYDIAGDIDGSEYNVTATGAQYSVGQAGGGDDGGDGEVKTVNLNLKIRLQGITNKPRTKATIPVKVGLGDGGLDETIYESSTFTVDDDGIWSGTISFEAPPGAGYKILVKPPYHLQKRICEAEPTEEEGKQGYYNCDRGNIEIKEGENNFDFSNTAILVGDLPDQDGIVNARDRVQCTEDIGRVTEDALSRSDVNFDGGINQIDCSLILYSMTIRHDDK